MTDSQNIDDNTLVRLSKHGNSEAMTHLIVRYQGRIYNAILKLCQNSDDAAELTQDTFVKVFEKLSTFRAESSFYTWLFRIAINLTLNHCKRRLKISTVSLDGAGGPDEAQRASLLGLLADSKGPDPVELARRKELVKIINDSIGQLPEEFRVVLVLRDIEQMSYAEIADVLELELGTVKSRLSRARGMLRDILETVLL